MGEGMVVSRPSAGHARRAAYVVLSHRYTDQVSQLVDATIRLSPSSGVLVYHDARACPPPVLDHPNVRVVAHRTAADWGSWELVESTIAAMGIAVRTFDPEMLVLVSGQDHPTRNLAHWERDFFATGGGWIGEAHHLVYKPRWGKPYGVGDDDLTRYIYRWYRVPGSRWLGRSEWAPAVAARSLLMKVGHYAEPAVSVRNAARGRGIHLGLRAIRGPLGRRRPCYKGSQWLAIERSHWDEMLHRHHYDVELRAAYRRSIIPDESYLQTILMSLGPPQTGPPLTYVDWRVAEDAPKSLSLEDLNRVLDSGSPFCRKIEPGISDALVERLDALAFDR